MAKKFEDFSAKAENYSDFQKVQTSPIAADLFVDDTTPEDMSTPFF
jgi:hypothetical protein